jgi:SAM-dependent methyltransferase
MSKNAFSQQSPQAAWADRLGVLGTQTEAAPPANRAAAPCPKRLNLGSGKSWHPDCLNLDINDFWRPDIVADFNHVFPPQDDRFETERFGSIRMEKDSFELIAAHDVLEHVAELTTCMKNCLDLLAYGGVFDILVPYDLSYGAWQDPTHVRAFNENSWLYFTDWFWYLGWTESRFEMVKLQFNLSDHGVALSSKGQDMEEIIRVPRAVDSMSVVLRKIPLSDRDRQVLAHHLKGLRR